MALQPHQTVYPFAEMFRVTTALQVAQVIWDIPAGTIITMVLAKIKTAGTGTGANIIVGDTDDDNGYILACAVCGTTVDTVFGDTVDERGAYLNHHGTAVHTHAGVWKVYSAAGKQLLLDCSADLTTEAVIDVFVFGYRYDED